MGKGEMYIFQKEARKGVISVNYLTRKEEKN